jgi:hypothetical protein
MIIRTRYQPQYHFVTRTGRLMASGVAVVVFVYCTMCILTYQQEGLTRGVAAFIPPSTTSLLPSTCPQYDQAFFSSIIRNFHSRRKSNLFVRKDWFAPDAGMDDDTYDDENDDDDDVVTREMLHRDLLKDPKVIRKRKDGKKSYRPLDNRDSLPFAVRHMTPDPYTHPQIKKLRERKSPPLVNKKKSDLTSLAPARLYQQNTSDGRGDGGKKSKDVSTLLGEFQLDKSTTSGYVFVLKFFRPRLD